jgi:lysophospholipase L1-like esterase
LQLNKSKKATCLIITALVLNSIFGVVSYINPLVMISSASYPYTTGVAIMPLGDSITVGVPPHNSSAIGYRQKLYLDLVDARLNVDFVGSESSGGDAITPFDIDHEGHGGWEADQVRDEVYGWLVDNPANITLLHIGTNDLGSQDAPGVRDEVDEILDEIDQYEIDNSVNITVILALIIQRLDGANDRTLEFNDLVEDMAMERISHGDEIIVVDMENALNYLEDMADPVHPNRNGYAKMADVWYEAILRVCNSPMGMISYWKLDEATSGIYEDSYNRNNGTGGSVSPIPVAGLVNGGQEFVRSSGMEIDITGKAFNWSVDDSFTLEFWMNKTSTVTGSGTENNEVIIGREGGGSYWWVGVIGNLSLGQQGRPVFVLQDTSSDLGYVNGTTFLCNGEWHHVVALRNTTHLSIYVDGSLESSISKTYGAGFSSSALLEMGHLGTGNHYDGVLDEVAIYNRALTSDEIEHNYQVGLQGNGIYSPEIVSTPLTNRTFIGFLYTYNVDAIGNPASTFKLETYPSGMTLNTTTGLIEWIPETGQEGIINVTVNATNTEGWDAQTFKIDVVGIPVFPEDMINYWKMDDAIVPPIVDSYGNNNGTCSDEVCPNPEKGMVNAALYFSGTDEVNVPDLNTWEWESTDSFTIEFWMNTSASFSENVVIVGRDDPILPLHWWVGCTGTSKVAHFGLRGNDDHYVGVSGVTILNDGSWHHIVAVRNESADMNLIYVDGVEENNATYNYTENFASTEELNIGWLDLGGGFHYTGLIDELAIYNRALTPDEIQDHYDRGLEGKGYCKTYISNLHLTVRGSNDNIYYRIRNETSWDDWNLLPGYIKESPSTAVLGGNLHVVVNGMDGRMYHGWVNLTTSGFSGWTQLSGSTPSAPELAS